MNRLMVPPLPAASRPSKSSTCLVSGVGGPGLELQQLDLEEVLGLVVLLARHPLVVGVVLAPGVDGPARRVDEDRVVVVVLADRVAVDVQPVDVLANVHEHAGQARTTHLSGTCAGLSHPSKWSPSVHLDPPRRGRGPTAARRPGAAAAHPGRHLPGHRRAGRRRAGGRRRRTACSPTPSSPRPPTSWPPSSTRTASAAATGSASGSTSGTTDLYVAILGILLAGAAYVPVDVDDPDERARLVFDEADVAAIVGNDQTVVDAPRRTARATPEEPGLGDDAWVIFTSGSTGTPKGVAVTHRSAAAFVDAESRLFLQDAPLGVGDRVMAGLSVAFDASCEEMWLAWRYGALPGPGAAGAGASSGIDVGPWLVANDITVVSTVPTLVALWPTESLADVRLLIMGGEACPPELGARLVGARPRGVEHLRPDRGHRRRVRRAS